MRLPFIIFSIFFIVSATAQTTQPGIVKEYNEKAKKTPLAGVEVRAKSANNAATGKDGKFELQFLTLKPGDRVDILRIEKLGYEIFNKEAVEQWNINPNTPFVVVMCRSDKFKKIRDNYEAKVSENYNKQYKKEIANLNKLKDEGKIKEEAYRKSLQEIQATYDKQLENLDNYVDRFARIDLSEISSPEQEIIELVQLGRFDEAIAKYDELDIQNKLTNQIKKRIAVREAKSTLDEVERQQTESIDRMYAMAEHQIGLLKLAGGKENNIKIKDIYLNIADADTTNIDWLNKTGLFISDYLADYNLALEYYKKALRNAISQYGFEHPDVAKTYTGIGSVHYILSDYENALYWYKKAFEISDTLQNVGLYNVAVLATNIGSVYASKTDYEAALDWYKKSTEIYEELLGSDHPNVAISYGNIGTVFSSQGNYANALEWINKAIEILEHTYGMENPVLAKLYDNVGGIHSTFRDYENSLNWYNKALSIRKKLFGLEHPDIAISFNNIGSIYAAKGDYDIGMDWIKKALAISENVFGHEHPEVADSFNYIGGIYATKGDYVTGLHWIKEALAIREKVFGPEHPEVAKSYNNIGLVYSFINCFSTGLDWYNKALVIREKIFGTEHLDVAECYYNIGLSKGHLGDYTACCNWLLKALSIHEKVYGAEHLEVAKDYSNLAYTYESLFDYSKAFEYYNKALNIFFKILDADNDVADIYTRLAHLCSLEKKYDESLEYYKNALNIYVNLPIIDIEKQVNIFEEMAMICRYKGDFEKAWEYSCSASEIRNENHYIPSVNSLSPLNLRHQNQNIFPRLY